MKNVGGLARDLIALVGAGFIVYGVSMIWLPMAWIVAGVIVIAACVFQAIGDE